MDADELELALEDEHISRSLGFRHPLVRLMPYPADAPPELKELEQQVWRVFDRQIDYPQRLNAALAIRPTLRNLDLSWEESAKVAIDLLSGLDKLLMSAAVMEQLAWAYLDREGIGLADRQFSVPPLHPLPVLLRLDPASGKTHQPRKGVEMANAIGVWTGVTMGMAAKPHAALDAMCAADLRASLRILVLFLLYGDLDKYRTTRAGRLDRFEDTGLSLWDELLTALRKAPEYRKADEEQFGLGIQRAVWHKLRSQELLPAAAAPNPSLEPMPATTVDPAATHVVIQGVIPPGTSSEDREQLARYERLHAKRRTTDLCVVKPART